MKYIVWLTAALGDVLVVGFVGYLLWLMPTNPLVWMLGIIALWVWFRLGALDAWRPSVIKQYFKNADKLGL